MLFGIGLPELMVLALLGLVVFGPERLPDMAAKAARGVKALRAMASNAIRELNIESATVTKAIGDLQSLTPRAIVGDVMSSVVNDAAGARPSVPGPRAYAPVSAPSGAVRPVFDPDAT